MVQNRPHRILSGGVEIAVEETPGAAPSLFWLSGFRSDMAGGKAVRLAEWGAATGRHVVRFDYRGHGVSDGAFEDFVLSDWLADAAAAHEKFCSPGAIAIGSSMGGWIALLLARRLLEQGRPLGGLVLIAPAADFTERLMWPNFSQEARDTLTRDGRLLLPSDYGEPTPVTLRLIEDGKNNLLYDAPTIETGCPVHILQGVQDPDVPYTHTLELVERLATDDVVLTLVKDGDHRLSREEDLERMIAAVAGIAG